MKSKQAFIYFFVSIMVITIVELLCCPHVQAQNYETLNPHFALDKQSRYKFMEEKISMQNIASTKNIEGSGVYPRLPQTSNAKSGLKNGQFKGYNIIMISLGNVGVEHMSLYGYQRKTTPQIDKWSRDALVFENAFSHGSWTLPVGTSLFTSLYPYSHGIMDRRTYNRLNQNIITFPEILQKYRYKTAAFTGGLDYDKIYSHMRGFDTMDDNFNFTGFSTTLVQAKEWLDQNKNQKFFLFIHGYDAHCPFTPPKAFRGIFGEKESTDTPIEDKYCVVGYKNSDENVYKAVYSDPCPAFGKRNYTMASCEKPKEIILTQKHINYLKARYDEEVLSVDQLLGDFLNSLDKEITEKTIFIIFSEHGEMFDKHGRFGRSGSIRGAFYDDVMHIPLIIKTPNKQHQRIKGLAQIIDIMPTLAQFLDIPIQYNIQGKSLLPLIKGDNKVNKYVYAGLVFNQKKSFIFPTVNEFIRDHQWKLIREVQYSDQPKSKKKTGKKEKFELYHFQDDPDELHNVITLYPEIAKKLRKQLKQWAEKTRKFSIFKPQTQEIPEDILNDAKKHGYW